MSAEISGLGVGLVSVPHPQRVLDRFGRRFEERIFLPDELRYAARKRNRAHSLAARLAAKCAGRRALAGVLTGPVPLREIEVARLPSGEPTLRLTRETARTRGFQFGLSLTHDPDFAVASVWLERAPVAPERD